MSAGRLCEAIHLPSAIAKRTVMANGRRLLCMAYRTQWVSATSPISIAHYYGRVRSTIGDSLGGAITGVIASNNFQLLSYSDKRGPVDKHSLVVSLFNQTVSVQCTYFKFHFNITLAQMFQFSNG